MPKNNPQLEEGYTRIANDLLEAILKTNIHKDELKVALAIIRQTYGWSRKEAEISYSMFEKLTNIKRRNIARALTNLLCLKLIKREKGREMKYGKPVYKYSIRKKDWGQYDNSTRGNMITETRGNMMTNKEIKENIKERRKSLVDKFKMK